MSVLLRPSGQKPGLNKEWWHLFSDSKGYAAQVQLNMEKCSSGNRVTGLLLGRYTGERLGEAGVLLWSRVPRPEEQFGA